MSPMPGGSVKLSSEIRSSFLRYFADRGHKIVPSSPLIPRDDPTLLFTNAGMNQFKGVFQGLEKRDYFRAASSQKCIRAGGKHNDLENVGFTARHHTFFEMMGNFSFGDYFKEEAIAFAWEYVTKTVGLDPKRLYATVYNEDDDAEKLWKKIAPELGDRVLRFGEKDNYWSMGDTGPCGPCSEIHYDRGEKYPGELNGDGDRFMEIWNLVFMQFNRDDSGKMTPLPKPSVDTGAGLERFCLILQNGNSNYETDLFIPLIEKVAELSGKEYSIEAAGVSHRVIADHIRALTFAIADGGIISNEGRGYVLRRILRRAARHGRLLDMHEPFLHKLVGTLTDLMGDQYPEIISRRKHIELVLQSEEEQFGRTLDAALERFEDIVRKCKSMGLNVIPGEWAFPLYDTYGLPIDLIQVMAKERGLSVDMKGFETELAKQRQRSKSVEGFAWVDDGETIRSRTDKRSEFIGYENEVADTVILAENERIVYLDQTPFYAESGGQIGDTGIIESNRLKFIVENTKKIGDDIIHYGNYAILPPGESAGNLYNENVTARVDSARRADIKRNHTATHLLHKALRDVLGDHVHQAGSLVAPDKLRFDFTHFKGMTTEEIGRVEEIVRKKIKEDLKVCWENKSLGEAKKMGAMALFGEKYGETVRVVTTGDPDDPFSMELCGGTHVDHTADIGRFFITLETAIAAGMRRIEAVTGRAAAEFFAQQDKILGRLRDYLGKDPDSLAVEDISLFRNAVSDVHRRILERENLADAVSNFQSLIDKSQKQKEKEEAGKLSDKASDLTPTAEIGRGKIFIYIVPTDNAKDLMVFADRFKEIHKQSIVITISGQGGAFAITSSDNELSQSVFKEISSISGARGGGKPTIRGSMPPERVDEVIDGLKKRFA